jgi:hypothetical protein
MIMEGGPVETAFTVYSDFEDYAGGLDLCINQIVEARLRHCWIMTSTPSTRRQLDGVAVWSLTDRFSQHEFVLAEMGLSEELSGDVDYTQVSTSARRANRRAVTPSRLLDGA